MSCHLQAPIILLCVAAVNAFLDSGNEDAGSGEYGNRPRESVRPKLPKFGVCFGEVTGERRGRKEERRNAVLMLCSGV
jgi:hypothetical protein